MKHNSMTNKLVTLYKEFIETKECSKTWKEEKSLQEENKNAWS